MMDEQKILVILPDGNYRMFENAEDTAEYLVGKDHDLYEIFIMDKVKGWERPDAACFTNEVMEQDKKFIKGVIGIYMD